LYQNILGSRAFQQKLFHKPFTFNDHGKKRTATLLQYLNITGRNEKEIFEKAYKKFNDDILYLHNDELDGALSVEITLPNAELAAKVANTMIGQLKKQVLAMIVSERDEKLRFIRQKIAGVKAKMDSLDSRLEHFLALAKDPTLPANQVRRMRIEREITVQTAVLTELKKQEEMFLLQQLPILKPVWVLDSAVAPYQSSRPKRILLFISLATIFFFLEFLFFNLKASLSGDSRNK
jgi:capsule polysaccharide export protein KpsE/RkpR